MSVEARIVTDLGHPGKPKKPRVFRHVLGLPESQCGDIRFYPGRKQIQELFETVWPPYYDTPAFEFKGDVICERKAAGHKPHPAVTIFDGLFMSELGIDGVGGTRPEPRETRLASLPDRGPTAEEVLENAIRAKVAGKS